MLPKSRKEMKQFIDEVSGGKLEVIWLDQGQVAKRVTADGNIFLEEREQTFSGVDAEADLREFFKGMVICGEKGITLRHQGLQNMGLPIYRATGTFTPQVYVMAYAMF